MDWHDRTVELIQDGLLPMAIYKRLIAEGYDVNYEAIKKFRQRRISDDATEQKVGKEEPKPSYEERDKGYVVYYGHMRRHKVFVSFEDLEEAFNLYCIAHLTLNEVCIKMNLTRREFYAIKTAFDITKDSLPFTPKQVDEYSADELAEKYRIKKKQYSIAKIAENKHKDIENRIKQMDTVNFWHSELCKAVNQISPEPYIILKTQPTAEEITVVYNTDVHGGLDVDNYFNTYNIEEMHIRFRKLAQGIIDNTTSRKVYIADLGDTVHGIIHGSVQKYSSWVTDSVTEVIRGYENVFITLVQEGYEVYFTKVNGSHESIEKAKDERTEEESFGNFIFDMLQWKYEKFKSLHFIPKLKGLNAAILPIFDYSTLLIHGDNNSLTKIKDAGRLFKEYRVKEINAGHLHHRKVEDMNGLNIFFNEPFCGTDQYAGNKLLSSDFGTRIVKYTPEGRGIEKLIRY